MNIQDQTPFPSRKKNQAWQKAKSAQDKKTGNVSDSPKEKQARHADRLLKHVADLVVNKAQSLGTEIQMQQSVH